ncbi:MAG: hypothetical protein U0790_04045 [Isosphaeraceae bacterium]
MSSHQGISRARAIARGDLVEVIRGESRGSLAISRDLIKHVDCVRSMGFIVDSGFCNFSLVGNLTTPFEWPFTYIVRRDDDHEDLVDVVAIFEESPGGELVVTYVEDPQGGTAVDPELDLYEGHCLM